MDNLIILVLALAGVSAFLTVLGLVELALWRLACYRAFVRRICRQ